VSWDLKFYEPIPLPRRKPLMTLRDAAIYITGLPVSERGAEHWRPAATLLRLIGENGGCVVFARIAVMYGLRKGVQDAPPEYDPERTRDRPWGQRKLKRDS
jgi:hypothetical protein